MSTRSRASGNVYRDNITPGDDVLLTRTWEPNPDAKKDGTFGYANAFMAPFQARLGFKFSF